MTVHTLAFKRSSQAIHWIRRFAASPFVESDRGDLERGRAYFVIDFHPDGEFEKLHLYNVTEHNVRGDESVTVNFPPLNVLKQIVMGAGL